MIYTLTLNPALDHIVRIKNLEIGETNRMEKALVKAGGKGINVSKLLKNLGRQSILLGYLGGFTGDELEKTLKKEGFKTDFIHVERGLTRINIKIKSDRETEINGPGLEIKKKEACELLKKLQKIKDGDYLFLSGSIPESLGDDFYKKIMQSLRKKDIKIIVDASGKALERALSEKPYLIKPNLRELEGIFGKKIENKEEISTYAKKLQELGARNIIVSLGKDGAYMMDEDKNQYFSKAPQGKLVDSVGSGDSMVAGFIYAKDFGFSTQEAFKFSLASGSATAFSSDFASKDQIYELYERLG